MIENKRHGKVVIKVIDSFFEILTFILIQYILACFLISFQANMVSVVISALDCVIVGKYLEIFGHRIKRKICVYAVIVVSVAVVVLAVIVFGYLPVSTTLKELK